MSRFLLTAHRSPLTVRHSPHATRRSPFLLLASRFPFAAHRFPLPSPPLLLYIAIRSRLVVRLHHSSRPFFAYALSLLWNEIAPFASFIVRISMWL